MIVVSPARGAGVATANGNVTVEDAYYVYGGGTDARITFASAGTATGEVTASSGPLSYAWLLSGAASDFEIYCQPTSGSVSGSATNQWLLMSSDRSWYNRKSTVAVLAISIRSVATQAVLTSGTISLESS